MQAAPALVLPELRPDLALLPGSAAEDGAPTWLIHDVCRNRYFRLGLDAFRALNHWRGGLPASEFVQTCQADGIAIDEDELKGLLQFMMVNQLILVQGPSALQRLHAQYQQAQHHWFKWLVHHYLFIRIPLWRPDAFLNRTWPLVARLLHPSVLWLVRALGVMGVLMVLQQWDVFLSTFLHFMSWQGLALYGLALAVVKSAHELGHAYMAKKYGCKVGSIGVAFLLMLPVFYTDTTDAWRLRASQDRLRIVLAGVGTEMHLAMLATFAWAFLPDGPWRSVAFFVATTSWVTSVLVNISPFMRFDGYFALSDLLRAENLQPRAFALARWHLRDMLFGLNDPVPEVLPPARKHLFIAYAYATWLYRLVLFLGIALLVYHFAFKLLGIVLFLVEIAWFIWLPMKNEMMQWWKRRADMRLNRHTLLSMVVVLAAVLAIVTPWRASVGVPAVLLAGEFRPVYAPEQGQLLAVHVRAGDQVQAGAVLIELQQPELTHALRQNQRELDLVNYKIERQVGSTRDLDDALVLQQKRSELEEKMHQLRQRQDRLAVRAPVAGRISQMEPLLTGQWVAENAPLLSIRSEQGLRVFALAPAEDLHRFEVGAQARWVSNLPGSPSLDVQLERIDQTALAVLPWPELASEFGGVIPVHKTQHNQLQPVGAWYQLALAPIVAGLAPTQQQAGQVVIESKAESLAASYWRYGAAVWVRESGF